MVRNALGSSNRYHSQRSDFPVLDGIPQRAEPVSAAPVPPAALAPAELAFEGLCSSLTRGGNTRTAKRGQGSFAHWTSLRHDGRGWLSASGRDRQLLRLKNRHSQLSRIRVGPENSNVRRLLQEIWGWLATGNDRVNRHVPIQRRAQFST